MFFNAFWLFKTEHKSLNGSEKLKVIYIPVMAIHKLNLITPAFFGSWVYPVFLTMFNLESKLRP